MIEVKQYPDDKCDVSVVIVNWNTRVILQGCLESIYTQTRQIAYEVIVIDNASSDDSVGMIKEHYPQVRLIENKDNRGFAAANNQGMRVAKGRYVLLLNSDTIVLDGAIQKTIGFADRHPGAAVVGCKVLNPDKTLQPTCFMFPSVQNMLLSATYLYKVFPRSRYLCREEMAWWNRDDEREVEVVTGCYMLVRKEAIDQVGMMDETFFMYGEEGDWCFRFYRAGWHNLFYPLASIIHYGGQSTGQIRPQMILQLRSAILQFIHKHNNKLTYRLACLLTSLFFLVRIPYHLFSAMSSGRQNSLMLARVYFQGFWKSLIGYEALCKKKNSSES